MASSGRGDEDEADGIHKPLKAAIRGAARNPRRERLRRRAGPAGDGDDGVAGAVQRDGKGTADRAGAYEAYGGGFGEH